ncbi:MAG: thioesterase domain-containing protein [Pseudomonadota bacterium]
MPDTMPPTRTVEEVRAWLVGEVARAVRSDPAGIDTAGPLDALGVDSLAAIGMAGGLAAFLGRDVPATVMWDHASIDAIAGALADAPPPTPGIVPLQPLGGRRPVFFFPGMGGHPVSFVPICAQLAPEHPCFGLTIPGLDGQSQLLESVESIASAMLDNVRRVQATGPYQFAGYSFGGFLAFEAARQLAAKSEATTLLAIFDTYTPGGLRPRPAWQRMSIHAYRILTRSGRTAYLRERLGRQRRAQFDPAPDADGNADAEAAVKAIQRRSTEMAKVFAPRPYSGRAVFFRAAQRADYAPFLYYDRLGGWSQACRGGVQRVDVPGTHLTMLNADNAAVTAHALRAFLA